MHALAFLCDRYFVGHIDAQPTGQVPLKNRPGRSELDLRPSIVQGDPDTLRLTIKSL
jgi:hypothetical protein